MCTNNKVKMEFIIIIYTVQYHKIDTVFNSTIRNKSIHIIHTTLHLLSPLTDTVNTKLIIQMSQLDSENCKWFEPRLSCHKYVNYDHPGESSPGKDCLG